jgi:hypothetical protein
MYLASVVMVEMFAVAGLGTHLLFAWFAPWCRPSREREK